MSRPPLQLQTTPVQLVFAMRYNGHALHGTALQPNVPTAAGLVLARVQRHLRPGRVWAVAVTARLDAGVHAHVNLISLRVALVDAAPSAVRRALDALEADTSDALGGLVGAIAPIRLSARGIAASKLYRYVIEDAYAASPAPAPWPLQDVWRVAPALDLTRMRQAACVFVGEHDFTGFAASPKRRGQSAAQAIKRILQIDIEAAGTTPHGGTRWHITCKAVGLLRRQMRFMVAGIVCAGAQLTDAETLHTQLAAGAPPAERAPQAPACGLYLVALACRGPAATLINALVTRLNTQCATTGATR